MKVLFLSQRVPFPPNRGDKITTWRLIERMARAHQVEVLAFAHDEADLAAADRLREKGFETTAVRLRPTWARARSLPLLLTRTPLTLGVFGSRALQREVDRRAAGADLAYAYSSSMGAFLLPHPRLRRVMHFAELDSDKWRQYAERARFPASAVYAREARTLLAFERRLAQAVDENVFCTPLEEHIFRELVPGAPSLVLRNGVDLSAFRPEPEAAEARHIVFTGVMDYHPNVDGCAWFTREILPRVQARFPDARLSIVGSRPTSQVQGLARLPGVTVTGFVPETRDWLRRAALAIAPLRIARGIQNKVLEAMAMGLPVVGTTPATQGVGARHEHEYLVADGVEAQIGAVTRLLEAPDEGRALGRRARAYVEAHYDWEACLRPLDALLARLDPALAKGGTPG